MSVKPALISIRLLHVHQLFLDVLQMRRIRLMKFLHICTRTSYTIPFTQYSVYFILRFLLAKRCSYTARSLGRAALRQPLRYLYPIGWENINSTAIYLEYYIQ
jgi:hypothetical protein